MPGNPPSAQPQYPHTPLTGVVATPIRGPPPPSLPRAYNPPFTVPPSTPSAMPASTPSPQITAVNPPTAGKGSGRRKKGGEKAPVDDAAVQLWIPKSISDLLSNILNLRGKYDTGGGSFKSQMWRVMKDQLEQQGHVRNVQQIKNKVFWLKTKW
jgi:hypothetical protein